MKAVKFLLLVFFPTSVWAQNVGIGTTSPTGKLQVNHRTASAIGLRLIDSTTNSAGSVEFRNVSRPAGIFLRGYTESDFYNGQYVDVVSDSAFVATFRGNGMVGIRTGTPLYPLHVNGDINTTGALRVSGDAGSGGQVLRSNGDGTMQWENICDYKNTVTFLSTPAGPWIVPAGVTKIMIEGWGAGGGGTAYGGGGGGGYVGAWLNVAPGDNITIQIGTGGTGGTATATSGGHTNITAPIGLFSGLGGQGSNYTGVVVGGGGGGNYDFPVGFQSFFGERGKNGTPQQFSFHQAGTSVFYETIHSGRGGDAGNINDNGGDGPVVVYNTSTSTIIRYSLGGNPGRPGGGGPPGYSIITGGGSLGGSNGASGMVIIRY